MADSKSKKQIPSYILFVSTVSQSIAVTEVLVLGKRERRLLYPSMKDSGASIRDVTKSSQRYPVSLYETLKQVENQGMKRVTLSLAEFKLNQDVFGEKVNFAITQRLSHTNIGHT